MVVSFVAQALVITITGLNLGFTRKSIAVWKRLWSRFPVSQNGTAATSSTSTSVAPVSVLVPSNLHLLSHTPGPSTAIPENTPHTTGPKCKFLLLELCLHAKVRASFRSKWHARLITAVLAAVVLFNTCLPLIVTGEVTFGAANKVCDENMQLRLAEPYLGQNAIDRALPHLHAFQTVATVISLLGFVTWLFYSPHKTNMKKEAALDRTLGSYYATNLLVNITLQTLAVFGCTDSQSLVDILVFFAGLFVFCGSILGTNLLCHRYLCEKAHVTIAFLNDPDDPSHAWLEKLEGAYFTVFYKHKYYLFCHLLKYKYPAFSIF